MARAAKAHAAKAHAAKAHAAKGEHTCTTEVPPVSTQTQKKYGESTEKAKKTDIVFLFIFACFPIFRRAPPLCIFALLMSTTFRPPPILY